MSTTTLPQWLTGTPVRHADFAYWTDRRRVLLDDARANLRESRRARLGLGNWAHLPPAVRHDNARSYLDASIRLTEEIRRHARARARVFGK